MKAILMTGCDLIAASKPWPVHTKAVKIIFEEFYEQVSRFDYVYRLHPYPLFRQKNLVYFWNVREFN